MLPVHKARQVFKELQVTLEPQVPSVRQEMWAQLALLELLVHKVLLVMTEQQVRKVQQVFRALLAMLELPVRSAQQDYRV